MDLGSYRSIAPLAALLLAALCPISQVQAADPDGQPTGGDTSAGESKAEGNDALRPRAPRESLSSSVHDGQPSRRVLRRRSISRRINPYLLARPSNYPGRIRGYLPGTKLRRWIPFLVRDGVAYFEGDIILGPSRDLAQRLARPNPRGGVLWPRGRIPYLVGPSIEGHTRTVDAIHAAISDLNQRTKLRLVPWSDEENFIKFVIGSGCASWVGMQGGAQEINVAPWFKNAPAYCSREDIEHQILHAVGLWHTHSRPDRDRFVTVQMDNLDGDHRATLSRLRRKVRLASQGRRGLRRAAYETQSIMHVGSAAFARDYWRCVGPDFKGGELDQCSLLTKTGGFIPHGGGLTDLDIRTINALYPDTK